jgi:hypothetical protein
MEHENEAEALPEIGSPQYQDRYLRLEFYRASNGDLDAAQAAYDWATKNR